MAANSLIFQKAAKIRDAVQASQQRKIAALYEQWAKDIGKKADQYAASKNASAPVSEMQMRELEKMLNKSADKVTKQVNGEIVQSIYSTANAVVEANADWLTKIGFQHEGVVAAFSHVPNTIVQNLINGQIYQGGWNLSKAIWGDNKKTLADLYEIVAAGVAKNMPVYDIAKLLEQYVSPSSAKPWNLKTADGKMIYKRKVDYNAQRLARTLIQHGYQQSFIAVTESNPMVKDYIWDANGSRVCPICKARDGKHFKKDQLPMDHPNGMCVMVPNTPSYKDMSDRLANWANGKKDPALDKFAKKLGYKLDPQSTGFTAKQKKYLTPYGFGPGNVPKDFDDWSHKVSYDQAAEILKSMGTSWADPHPYQKLQKFYDKYLVPTSGQTGKVVKSATVPVQTATLSFAEKYGTSSGAKFNYWYTKLSPEAKAEAAALKAKSGQTWQQWYEANVYKPKGGATVKKPSTSIPPVANVADVNTSGWITKARRQTEGRMLATEAENFAKMSDKQSSGIRRYTGSAYTRMNGYLRYRAGGMSHSDAMAKARMDTRLYNEMLDASDGLKAVSTREEFVLRRGTDLGDLAGLMQGDFDSNRRKLQGMSVEELNKMFAGHVGTYAGFTSTSSIWSRGFAGSVEVVMRAPVGTQGSSVMSISQFGTGEGEFLLNAGTRVRVIKVEESDNHMESSIRVYMEIIGADEIKAK